MLSSVVVAPWQHALGRRGCARSQPRLRGEGVSPPVLCGRRPLLVPHVLAGVIAAVHVSDLIAGGGPFI